jgi:hypothetical protein
LNFTPTSNPGGETEGDHLTTQTREESPFEDFCGSQSNIINNIKCLYGIVTEMISEWLYIRVNHCPNFFLIDLKVETVDILPDPFLITELAKTSDMISISSNGVCGVIISDESGKETLGYRLE